MNWGINLKKVSYIFSTILVIGLLSGTLSRCEPEAKKQPEVKNSFTYKDLESVVLAVDKFYIDKSINKNRAYTDAAFYTLLSMPHPLYLYPESYFNEREKYEDADSLLPVKSTFKLSPSDKFIIMDPDYVKVEEMRKAKIKKNENRKMSDEEVKKLIEKDKLRKSVLSAKWEETRFSKKDFDKIIAYVEENLAKYKEPALPNSVLDLDPEIQTPDEEKKADYTINDVYLAAANGYLSSLDPHSNVFLREAWEESMAKINDSSFEGIGAILSGGGTREVVVENPLEGSPALKSGLRSGDVILAVDKISIAAMNLDKVVKRIKGKKATEVVLTIRRKGVTGTLDIPIIRDTITIKNLTYRILKEDPEIAYIKLTGFIKAPNEDSVDSMIAKAVRDMERESSANGNKLKGIILDLRNNSGGYLDLAIDIADLFIDKGLLIVSTKVPNRSPEEAIANNKKITDLPLVILMNAKSASASEIVASAIQHHGRGLLLGERTFGKATVQKSMDLPGNQDFVLKITNSRYYSPSGKTIQVVGVTPDIEISEEADGSFPFRYREEDMWNHLPEIPSASSYKSRFNVPAIKEHVKKFGKSDKYLSEHSDDQIRPDYMLIRSLDYVRALADKK
ncbi:S41 family peptidase [Leptospira sp. GIMC2001]|uniref:S41 family peptidase n=1 Tax=Leptospira sp. GIMC2001 TaxID=1513297 RepID=UPI00234935BC|nr:S41 family peptidase [Leptospira sp. GIMC2001]WCL50014.1 S41 family peptidase [Leptospira sp. GIMC2001]